MKKETMTIKLKKPKIRNSQLMNMWQSGMLRTKVIPNKKRDVKKYNWKKDMTDYLNIKKFILVLK